MPLPPVVAELRASIGDFTAKMGLARESWATTAGTIADPAPLLKAQRGLADLAVAARDTTKSTAVLGETSRDSFRVMSSGVTSVLPGFNELVGVTGRLSEQFGRIGEASATAMETAGNRAKALRLQIAQVTLAMDAEIKKTEEVGVGSRAWQVSATRVMEYRGQIDKLNAALVTNAADQKRAASAGANQKLGAGVLGGAAMVGAAGVGIGYEAVKAALAEETSQRLLKVAVDKTKESFAAFTPHLEETSAKMRNLGFADAETADSAAKLTTSLHNPEKALQLVALAADVARARHIDLAEATKFVSKAAVGNTSVLTRMGLASKDAAGHTLSAKAAINELAHAYGGAASAYGSTLQGKWDVFKAQLDAVLVRIGNWLIPKLSELLTEFQKLAGWLDTNVVPVFKRMAAYYDQNSAAINKVVLALAAGLGAFKLITGAVNAFNLILRANPLAALATAFAIAYAKSQAFRDAVNKLAGDLAPLARHTDAVKTAVELLIGAWAAFKFAGLISNLAAWATGLLAVKDAEYAVRDGEVAMELANPVGAVVGLAAAAGYASYKMTGWLLGDGSPKNASDQATELTHQLEPMAAKLRDTFGPITGTDTRLQDLALKLAAAADKMPGTGNAAVNLGKMLTHNLGLSAATAKQALEDMGFSAKDAQTILDGFSSASIDGQLSNITSHAKETAAALAVTAAAAQAAGVGGGGIGTAGWDQSAAGITATLTAQGDPSTTGALNDFGSGLSDVGGGSKSRKSGSSGSGGSRSSGRKTTTSRSLSGLRGNAATIASFLAAKGLTNAQIAGVLGNLQVESNFSTTATGDGGLAYGIAQWHPDRRPVGGLRRDLGSQLNWLWKELTGSESGALSALRGQSTAGGAAAVFDRLYERSSGAARGQRIADARTILAKLGNTNTGNTNTSITTGSASVTTPTITAKALATLLAHQKKHDAALIAALQYKQSFTDISSLGTDPKPGQAAVLKLQDAAAIAALKAANLQADAATIAAKAGATSSAALKAKAAADTAAANATAAQNSADLAAAKQAAAETLAQKAAELAAAKKAAADAVVAAKQAALELQLANRIAANAAVSLFDNGVLNRGADFAQTVASNRAAATVTVNVAGHVTTERDLLAAVHEGLLTYGRTNIGTGLN